MRAYATARRLRYDADLDQPGFLTALPIDPARRFNILRGALPGGADGMFFHQLALRQVTTPNGRRWVARAYTAAATRVPEAIGVLLRFQIGRNVMEDDRYWQVEELTGLDRWKLAVAPAADRAVLDPFLSGAVRDLVAGQGDAIPQGFTITFRCGCLSVQHEGHVETPFELDRLAHAAAHLGTALRTACARATRPLPFDAALPPPAWLGSVDEPLARIGRAEVYHGDRFADVVVDPGLDVPPDEQVRGWAEGVARQRGLVAEDALAFHRAFPRVTRAGQAFAVFRGQLPGTDVRGRLVAYAERQLQLPHSGVNAALVPVRSGIADAPTQTLADGLAAGVRGGVLNVSRLRLEPGLEGGDLDRLATEAVEIAESWGVLDRRGGDV